MKSKYKVGDTVEIVENKSGGFVNKSLVEVLQILSEDENTQKLLLSDGIYNSVHNSDEIRPIN